MIEVLRRRRIELADHVSRRLTEDAVERADLIITMEHHQVAEVVLMAPDAWERAFTLREIVLRGQEAGKRRSGESLSDWTQRVGAGRTRMELVGAWNLDIPDPVGQGAFHIERTVDDLEELVDRFVELAWPRRGARSA